MATIEKYFAARTPADVSVEDLLNAFLESPARCLGCKYDLRAHSAGGRCPECGLALSPFLERDRLREILIENLSDCLGVRRDKIKPDSLLIRDLGMS